MTDSECIEDVAAYNERSLKTLARSIALAQGRYSLALVRCNYAALRERMLLCVQELSGYEIRKLILPESAKTLLKTIKAEVGNNPPPALMVLGLETVTALDDLLKATNQVRDEFPKSFSFPLVLWVTDEVLQKLMLLAPDFHSRAGVPIKFAPAMDKLIGILRQNADRLFSAVLAADADKFVPNSAILDSPSHLELDAAWKDLQSCGQLMEPALTASAEFFLGRDDYANDQIDKALEHYDKSLAFWRQEVRREREGESAGYTSALHPLTPAPPHPGTPSFLERQGVLLFHIGLCHRRHAQLRLAQSHHYLHKAKLSFEQCIEVFEQAQRQDLVAKFIGQMGRVLRRLKAWDELQILAQQSLKLHQIYGSVAELAQDYGFLAEVALEQSSWEKAHQLVSQALQTLAEVPQEQRQRQGLYLLLLARSQQILGQLSEALGNLEKARNSSNPQYAPQLYIDILKALRSLYFERKEYLKAFEIKLEQRSIEAQYGFRPFTGGRRLLPIKRVINPALDKAAPQARAQERIAASGRLQDINHLLTRLSRNDHKLIVIHGLSGVGKSSLLWAGLVPALKQQVIGDHRALPVPLRVYSNWVRELGKSLAEALTEEGIDDPAIPPRPFLQGGFLSPPLQGGLGGSLDSPEAIIEQLKKNADRNWLTVLIFDQFEEFFFVCTDLIDRQTFYEFIRVCLNIPFVKIILSLREDYLHYLLEFNRFTDLDVINNNILDKTILYYLGNFSTERAKLVIKELTEGSQFYLEPELIDDLVRDLAGELGEVRPIELQVVGAQLQTDNITTLAQYQQYGPKGKLVERSLEEVIEDCGSENERAARLILYLLTNENGTRPLKTRAELIAGLKIVGFELEVDKLDLVLQVLVGAGLVFLVPESPADRYQLIHDYLVTFIRQQQAPGLLAELAEAKEKQKQTEEQLRQALREKEQALHQEQQERQRATIAEIEALSSLSQALLLSDDQLVALLASVKAARKLQETEVPSQTKTRALCRLWQAVYSVKERNRFGGHSEGVWSVSFSPDGQRLASASGDFTVKLWSLDSTVVQTFEGHSGGVCSVSFSPDGQIIASASGDGTVKLWRTDGTVVQTFGGHSGAVNSVSFSPDGQIIASASGDCTIKLWSLDGTVVQTLQGHKHWVNSVSFSPDGQTLASASSDGTVKLWHLDGTVVQTFEGHSGGVNNVSLRADDQTLASASRDGDSTVNLWRLGGTVVQTLQGHSGGVNSVSFSPGGQILASASDDGTVKLWRKDGKELQTFQGHSSRVWSVSFSSDGQTLASASTDGTVKLWRKDGQELQTFQGHRAGVWSLSFSPDGQTLASANADGTVKLWHKNDTQLQTFGGHSAGVWGFSFSPDGQTLASANGDGTVKLWRKDGKFLQTFRGHRAGVWSVSFSPDGQILASASDDSTVKLWRKDGTLVRTFEGHSSAVTSVSFSPDGQTLASASGDGTVKLWRKDGTQEQTFGGHRDWIWSISFSPDGHILALASHDFTVKLWRKDGTLLQIFGGHSGGVRSVSFSPDGQTLASASDDRTVKLWRIDGTLVQTFGGHSGGVRSVSFSPDGQTLVSASDDRTVKLWCKDGTLLQTFEGHSHWVNSVSFSPDGQIIASASSDSKVIVWNLAIENLLRRGCDWLRGYLKTNPNMNQSDRAVCDGIGTHK